MNVDSKLLALSKEAAVQLRREYFAQEVKMECAVIDNAWIEERTLEAKRGGVDGEASAWLSILVAQWESPRKREEEFRIIVLGVRWIPSNDDDKIKR